MFSGLAFVTVEPPETLPLTEPVLVNGQLVFPPGAAIPRSMTQAERDWLANNPQLGDRAGGPPPTGPIHCAAEYEPMQAILLSWNGTSTWLTIVGTMASRITRYGNAEAWVAVGSAATRTSATTALTNAGADMTKVRFFIRPLDTIWIRDYGPRYIFQGGCRAIVDHVYNRPRPNDDTLPAWLGPQLNQPVYSIPLTHGGGNYHLDAINRSYATRLIANENPSLSEQTIIDTWHAFQGVDTHLFDPFPTSVDSTQHLDMWMEVVGDNKVMVSDWPNNPGSPQDVICDAAAVFMASRGYTVYRLPAFSISGTHYTYCNVVTCNNLLLLPTYTQATVMPFNATALATWQAALPGKTIAQVNCQAIVTSAGVMHCIAMHVPRSSGGINPVAYVISPNSGEHFIPGDSATISYAADDDLAVTGVDIRLSTDGGATFPTLLASHVPPVGSFNWTVTSVPYTVHARVRVIASDADAHTGSDDSDSDFTIGQCPADFNSDGAVDFFDYDEFVQCFEGGTCPPGKTADFNNDTAVDFFDYDQFVQAYELGC